MTPETMNYPYLITSSAGSVVVTSDTGFIAALKNLAAITEYRPTKQDVGLWEDVGTYVATYPMGNDPDGACDVTVQIGCDAPGISWFIRTVDAFGGSDAATDKPFAFAHAAALAEAYRLIDTLDEGLGMSAEDYLVWLSDATTTEGEGN